MKKVELEKVWKLRVADFRSSNQSLTAWCKTNNLKPNSFRYWLDKDNAKGTVPKAIVKTQWLRVKIDSDSSENSIQDSLIVKVGSATIEVKEGFNKKLFKDIIEVLIISC